MKRGTFVFNSSCFPIVCVCSPPACLVHLEEGTERAKLGVLPFGSSFPTEVVHSGLCRAGFVPLVCLKLELGANSTRKSISKLCPPKRVVVVFFNQLYNRHFALPLIDFHVLQLVCTTLKRSAPLFMMLLPILH